MDYTNLDQDVVNLARAIRDKESNGGKNMVSKLSKQEGSNGSFQYLRPTFQEQGKALGGKDLNGNPLDINNQEHQNLVFYTWAKNLKDQGYGVDQIAAAHNAGEGNINNWQSMKGVNKYGNKYNVPAYVNEVVSKYQKNKSESSLNFEDVQGEIPQLSDREQRIQKGLPVSINPEKTDPSLIGSMLRGILKVPARATQSIISAINPNAKGLSGEYLGKVNPITGPLDAAAIDNQNGGFKGLVQGITDPVGVGIEAASNIVGGVGAKQVAQTGLKGLLTQGLKTGLKEGFVTSSLYAGGDALQKSNEEKTVQDKLIQGLSTIALGTVGGGVLGTATAGLSRVIKGVRPSKVDFDSAVNDLELSYEKLAGNTQAGKRKIAISQDATLKKNQAGTDGFTPQNILAKEGIVPNVKQNQLNTTEQAKDYLKKTLELNSAGRKALQELDYSTPPTSLSDFRNEALALAKTDKNIDSGVYKKLEKVISQEIDDYAENYGETITASKLGDIKSARWSQTNFNPFKTVDDKLKEDADYLIAKAAQKRIEKIADDAGVPDIAQFNRDMGDRLGAAKFLADLDGRSIKGSFTTKLATRIIGGSMGNSIPSRLLGMLGGDLAADILIRESVTPETKRVILKQLETDNPESYKALVKYLNNQNLIRETRLKLPAGSPKGTVNNPIIVNPTKKAEITVTTGDLPLGKGRLEKDYQSLPKKTTDIKDAKAKATINSNISKSIPQKTSKNTVSKKVKK